MQLYDKDLLSVQEVRDLVEKAKKAQQEFAQKSQEEVDAIVKSVAEAGVRNAKRLAKMAHEETGFGIEADKVIKNVFGSRGVYEAIKDNLESICNSIKMILEKTPPELAKDIIHSGIYITGGSSQIHDLDKLFADITGIDINTCEEPEECVVRGLVKIVSDSKYKHLAFSMKSKILI